MLSISRSLSQPREAQQASSVGATVALAQVGKVLLFFSVSFHDTLFDCHSIIFNDRLTFEEYKGKEFAVLSNEMIAGFVESDC